MENNKDNGGTKYITLIDNGFDNPYYEHESVGSVIKFNNIALKGSNEKKAQILANKIALKIIEQCKDSKSVKIVLSLFLHGDTNNNTKTHDLVYDQKKFNTLAFYHYLLQELEKYPDVIKSIFINNLSCNAAQILTNTNSKLKNYKNLQSVIYTSSIRANSIENALFMNHSIKNYQCCDIIGILKIACIYGIKITLIVEDDDHNLHPIYVKFDLKSVANLKLRLEIFNNKLRELFEVSTFVKNEYGDIKSKDGEVAFENLKKDFEKIFNEHEHNPDVKFKMIFVSIFNQLAYNRRKSKEKKAKYNEFCQSDTVQDVLTEILMIIEKQPHKYEKEYKALFLNLLLFSMVEKITIYIPFSGSGSLYFDQLGDLSKFAKQFLETSSKLTVKQLFSYDEPLNYRNFINYAVIGRFQELKNKSKLHLYELSIVNLDTIQTVSYDRALQLIEILNYAIQRVSYDRALQWIEILKKNQKTLLLNGKRGEFIQLILKNKKKIIKIIDDNKESEMQVAKYINDIYLKVISTKSTKCSALVKKSAVALLCICVSCGLFVATQSR